MEVPLKKEHVQPYLKGRNYFRHTIPRDGHAAETFLGEVKNISFEESDGAISSIKIQSLWMIRVHTVEKTGHTDNPQKLVPVNGKNPAREVTLELSDPILTKVRSPLTFISVSETIELTHLTDLADQATQIKCAIFGVESP